MQFYNDYYEQQELWDKDYLALPAERERILQAVSLIPKRVKSILDVGCGNGAFLRALPGWYQRAGLDLSRAALKHAQTARVQGRSSMLPFPTGSFDVVTCFEVLEHLPQHEFTMTVSELERVARKFIMVSVPNTEDLAANGVVCPACQCRFHPYRHVRSFSEDSLTTLFHHFRLKELHAVGPREGSFNVRLMRLYRTWFRTPLPSTGLCPQCGYSPKMAPDRRLAEIEVLMSAPRTLITVLKMVFGRRRWLLALYVKADA